jgi:threonine/homoserine/homoserine lactone efflux protein
MNFDFNVLAFVLSVAAILLTPGPTNTILAVAGLGQGTRAALPLIVFELFGYLVGISAWGIFLTSAQHHYPWLGVVVRVASSAYLVYVAVKLWRAAQHVAVPGQGRLIGPGAMFVATLLNPKGLLFASVIFPAGAFGNLPLYLGAMLLFCSLLVPIGFTWIKFGAALSGGRWFHPSKLQRAAALVIGMFSATIAWAAFH